MVIDFKVYNDHSVYSMNKSIGVQGDHEVDIVRVNFSQNDFRFDRGRINFVKDGITEVCTDYISIGKDQVFSYEIPYDLIKDCKTVALSVTALTLDGKIFESRELTFEVHANDIDPTVVNEAFPLEDVTVIENNTTVTPSNGYYGIGSVSFKYSLKRGVDYWTEDDIAEIQGYIDTKFGDVNASLDAIVALQEAYIGGSVA